MVTTGNVGRASRKMLLCIPILLTILALTAVACGVKAGDNTPARPGGGITEFHRSPVTAFEQFRVTLEKTDAGCTADPSDITVTMGQRVRLAIQLPTEVAQGATGSLIVTGDRFEITYGISGLEISSSGGAFGTGVTAVNLTLESGAKQSYDFNPAIAGAFEILCDGEKVGTFTVNPA